MHRRLGGDLLQEVWCQYLRGGYSCWKKKTADIYAMGAIGDNSYYHSAMGGRLCYAVLSGRRAATRADSFRLPRAKLATPQGVKELSIEQMVPGDMLVDGKIPVARRTLQHEILTSVVIPPPKARRAGHRFEKASRPRGVWDFAMASLGDQSSTS